MLWGSGFRVCCDKVIRSESQDASGPNVLHQGLSFFLSQKGTGGNTVRRFALLLAAC